MTVKQAAHKVLSRLGEAHYRDIAREIQDRGLASLTGKTPEASVYASIASEMKAEGERSEFIRVSPGVFALRDQHQPTPPPTVPQGADQGRTTEEHGTAPMPRNSDLLWPTLRALETLGGSATNNEIVQQVARDLALSGSVLGVLRRGGPMSEFEYRAAWARTSLKNVGAVVRESRGVWAVTPEGMGVESEEKLRGLVRRGGTLGPIRPPRPEEPTDQGSDADWKHELLEVVGQMKPDAFERLCQRILRKAGFVRVKVTGRSGDGGIDGVGVLRVKLLSFHVAFQCKRYAGSVGPGEVRDFRGGLVGRADKGLVMTTGRFTANASSEAVRDGALAIDLVDGDELCELLKKYHVGTRVETVERVHVDVDFFKNL